VCVTGPSGLRQHGEGASIRDFVSDDNFKFKALDHEHDGECDEWNAECSLKLKEVMAAERQQFKWQCTAAAATPNNKPFAEWLVPRILLSDYCTVKSAVMPTPASKHRMRMNTRRYALECDDTKTSAKFE